MSTLTITSLNLKCDVDCDMWIVTLALRLHVIALK